VQKIVAPTAEMTQTTLETPPVVASEKKNSAGQRAREASRKSDCSSDGFCQLGVAMSSVPPSAEMLQHLKRSCGSSSRPRGWRTRGGMRHHIH
jgi:hypothetical protein